MNRMSLCWYCHWGWPKAIRDIYLKAEADIDRFIDNWPKESNDWTDLGEDQPYSGKNALEYGPAHTVWCAENFDAIGWNIRECDASTYSYWHPEILQIVKRSLEELDKLPRVIRNPPKGYDGENPENYPPPQAWEIKK